MKKIQLNKGKIALIDDEDYEIISKRKWYVTNEGYAKSCSCGECVFMHRLILGITNDPDVFTDHINHDKLNNTRSNLRKCTKSENSKNALPRGRSKYNGVTIFYNSNGMQRIMSRIRHDNKRIHLGCFNTEIQAAKAYDQAAKKYHKEFANLNFK